MTSGHAPKLVATVHTAVGLSDGLGDGGPSVGSGVGGCGPGAGRGGLGTGIRVGSGLMVGTTGGSSQPATRIPAQSILHRSPKLQQPTNWSPQKLLLTKTGEEYSSGWVRCWRYLLTFTVFWWIRGREFFVTQKKVCSGDASW